MAATKVTRLWTAFTVVILKFLAALGFRTPATASSAAFTPYPAPAEGATHGTAAQLAAGTAGVGGASGRPYGAGEAAAPPPGNGPDAAWQAADTESPDRERDFGFAPDAPLFAAARMMYGRTLPPTMKQRIRAEAHGAAPSSRCVQSDAFDAPYTGPVGAPPARPAAVPSARGAVPAARRPERVLCPA
ncbi:DUF6344 domain-containing protein [Streptomyces sp. NPDC052496]|uniref:DUF6344 domain-containing protein n=1 Tax=Streptomyces sp. NPDC052496 TaxID=3154951 RepID=UPI00342A8649